MSFTSPVTTTTAVVEKKKTPTTSLDFSTPLSAIRRTEEEKKPTFTTIPISDVPYLQNETPLHLEEAKQFELDALYKQWFINKTTRQQLTKDEFLQKYYPQVYQRLNTCPAIQDDHPSRLPGIPATLTQPTGTFDTHILVNIPFENYPQGFVLEVEVPDTYTRADLDQLVQTELKNVLTIQNYEIPAQGFIYKIYHPQEFDMEKDKPVPDSNPEGELFYKKTLKQQLASLDVVPRNKLVIPIVALPAGRTVVTKRDRSKEERAREAVEAKLQEAERKWRVKTEYELEQERLAILQEEQERKQKAREEERQTFLPPRVGPQRRRVKAPETKLREQQYYDMIRDVVRELLVQRPGSDTSPMSDEDRNDLLVWFINELQDPLVYGQWLKFINTTSNTIYKDPTSASAGILNLAQNIEEILAQTQQEEAYVTRTNVMRPVLDSFGNISHYEPIQLHERYVEQTPLEVIVHDHPGHEEEEHKLQWGVCSDENCGKRRLLKKGAKLVAFRIVVRPKPELEQKTGKEEKRDRPEQDVHRVIDCDRFGFVFKYDDPAKGEELIPWNAFFVQTEIEREKKSLFAEDVEESDNELYNDVVPIRDIDQLNQEITTVAHQLEQEQQKKGQADPQKVKSYEQQLASLKRSASNVFKTLVTKTKATEIATVDRQTGQVKLQGGSIVPGGRAVRLFCKDVSGRTEFFDLQQLVNEPLDVPFHCGDIEEDVPPEHVRLQHIVQLHEEQLEKETLPTALRLHIRRLRDEAQNKLHALQQETEQQALSRRRRQTVAALDRDWIRRMKRVDQVASDMYAKKKANLERLLAEHRLLTRKITGFQDVDTVETMVEEGDELEKVNQSIKALVQTRNRLQKSLEKTEDKTNQAELEQVQQDLATQLQKRSQIEKGESSVSRRKRQRNIDEAKREEFLSQLALSGELSQDDWKTIKLSEAIPAEPKRSKLVQELDQTIEDLLYTQSQLRSDQDRKQVQQALSEKLQQRSSLLGEDIYDQLQVVQEEIVNLEQENATLLDTLLGQAKDTLDEKIEDVEAQIMEIQDNLAYEQDYLEDKKPIPSEMKKRLSEDKENLNNLQSQRAQLLKNYSELLETSPVLKQNEEYQSNLNRLRELRKQKADLLQRQSTAVPVQPKISYYEDTVAMMEKYPVGADYKNNIAKDVLELRYQENRPIKPLKQGEVTNLANFTDEQKLIRRQKDLKYVSNQVNSALTHSRKKNPFFAFRGGTGMYILRKFITPENIPNIITNAVKHGRALNKSEKSLQTWQQQLLKDLQREVPKVEEEKTESTTARKRRRIEGERKVETETEPRLATTSSFLSVSPFPPPPSSPSPSYTLPFRQPTRTTIRKSNIHTLSNLSFALEPTGYDNIDQLMSKRYKILQQFQPWLQFQQRSLPYVSKFSKISIMNVLKHKSPLEINEFIDLILTRFSNVCKTLKQFDQERPCDQVLDLVVYETLKEYTQETEFDTRPIFQELL